MPHRVLYSVAGADPDRSRLGVGLPAPPAGLSRLSACNPASTHLVGFEARPPTPPPPCFCLGLAHRPPLLFASADSCRSEWWPLSCRQHLPLVGKHDNSAMTEFRRARGVKRWRVRAPASCATSVPDTPRAALPFPPPPPSCPTPRPARRLVGVPPNGRQSGKQGHTAGGGGRAGWEREKFH